MSGIKKAWITEFDAELVSLSLESENAFPCYKRVSASEVVFPDRENHLTDRHTVSIKLLSKDDLRMISDAIKEYLG